MKNLTNALGQKMASGKGSASNGKKLKQGSSPSKVGDTGQKVNKPIKMGRPGLSVKSEGSKKGGDGQGGTKKMSYAGYPPHLTSEDGGC